LHTSQSPGPHSFLPGALDNNRSAPAYLKIPSENIRVKLSKMISTNFICLNFNSAAHLLINFNFK
ncbi:MAG TPA: hypothetical protein O0X44_02410, partial [Methanocorpusculum sp.]|nr:hypothetical protein [Methanocorpusculum sp.]